MIEVRDLVKEYRAGGGMTVRAVDGVSFHVADGEMVGLLGGNGAGKTTTMRGVATLLTPTSGMARVAGHDVRTDPIGVRRSLGYVSATTGVADRLSPREVLDSSGRLHGIERRLLADRIAWLTASLDLGSFLDRPCGRLSSGQRQRVSLARALVHDPPALVLDEPTSTLDVVGARDLFAMLQSLRAEGRTILVSTHRLHEIEHRCDRFVIIDAGRIVAAGSRAELVADRSGGLEEAFFATIGGGAA
ncbi:MAG: ABC transporter ATP-binding protein [Planctomycetota bacterium]|nr:MAG: ABC transporter ATP-binding protein [Planctomycetota bacterium]